jgi:hypothetical protein
MTIFSLLEELLSKRKLTRMLILELGDIVDIFVNHNPQAVALAMRRHVVLAEGL